MEKQPVLTREMAWNLHNERLIKLANHNTFFALVDAFETAWIMATENAKIKQINNEDG